MKHLLTTVFISILLISCQSPTGSNNSSGDQNQTQHNPYKAVKYSYPVAVDKIFLDPNGVNFIWADIANSYILTVTDSSDSTILNLMTNANSYVMTDFEYNKNYLVTVDCVDRLSVFKTSYTAVDSVLGKIIFAGDSIEGFDIFEYFGEDADTLLTGFILSPSEDSSKFTVLKLSSDIFSISTNTDFSDTILVFRKGTSFAKSFKTEVFSPPDSLTFTMVGDTLNLKWIGGKLQYGYIAYLRDIYGSVLDSVTTLADSAKFILESDNAYKVNIATLSELGPGTLDSVYLVDTVSGDGVAFKLPYKYVSTFQAGLVKDSSEVAVSGGLFIMGDISFENSSALPLHEVCVSSFYMGKTEVSVASFVDFLNFRDSLMAFSGDSLLYSGFFIADTSSLNWFIGYNPDSHKFVSDSGMEKYPVVGVSWFGAVAYCNMLSDLNSLNRCYDEYDKFKFTNNNGYRLPTEAEFEYVASGAVSGYKQLSPFLNAETCAEKISAVDSGSLFYGMYNICGNAYEWVNDFTDGISMSNSPYYSFCKSKGVVKNPIGPTNGNSHILRGGSFLSRKKEVNSIYRYRYPYFKRHDFGFRVARNNE